MDIDLFSGMFTAMNLALLAGSIILLIFICYIIIKYIKKSKSQHKK